MFDVEGRVRDLARNTIIYHADKQKRQGEALKTHLKGMAKKGQIVDYKEQDYSATSGYKGFMVHIKTKGKRQGEIQVLSDKMIYAKEHPDVAKAIIGTKRWNEIRRETGLPGGKGHEYYEKSRVSGISKRSKNAWERKSRRYYKNFY